MKLPPAHLLMQISNNPSADDFVASFGYTRNEILTLLTTAGLDIKQFTSILDFGCGVGRFLFAMQDQLEPRQKLFGCDVDADCVTWCRENIDFADVRQTKLDPPLPYADESFDFIYALSVFTHLSFDLQFAWARELRRVTRPGGVIFFTTHGEIHLLSALAHTWPETDFALLGEDGLLCTFSQSRARKIEGQREVAVVHSRSAIDEVFYGFAPLYHCRISNMAGGQSVSIRQRPWASLGVIPVTPERRDGTLKPTAEAAVILPFTVPAFSGSRPFRALLSFAQAWNAAGAIRYEATVVAGGQELKREIIELPFKSFAGPRHFLPLTVEVPGTGAPCEVIWKLGWKGKWRTQDKVDFALSHARLESGS